MKEAFDVEQRQKEKQQAMLRIALIVLAIVSAGLAVFSFVSANMIFGGVFVVLALIFIIGIFAIKTKEVGHSETFTKEIDDLQRQIDTLEQNYDLNFDLDAQYRTRDQWFNAMKTKESLEKKRNILMIH